MATPTYIPLATYTVTGAAAASVTFSSIPATYRDLILVINGGASASATIEFQFNGDTTGANYSQVNMTGNGSTASSSAQTDRSFIHLFASNSVSIVQFMDYSATDKHKTTLIRDNGAANEVYAKAARWANTSAITSVKFEDTAGATIDVGSTFSLYGVN